MRIALILLAMCGLAARATPEHSAKEKEDGDDDIVVKSTSFERDGVKIETKKFYRQGEQVMVAQTTTPVAGKPTSAIFLCIGNVVASLPLLDGKIARALVEPNRYAVAIADKDSDGEMDSFEILDDDMNLLQAYRKKPGGFLRPLSTREVNQVILEREKKHEAKALSK